MAVSILLTKGFLAGDLSTEKFESEASWRPGLADRSEGLGAGLAQGLSIKVRGLPIEVRGWKAGLAQALSIKVRDWEGPGWLGHVDKSEGLQ